MDELHKLLDDAKMMLATSKRPFDRGFGYCAEKVSKLVDDMEEKYRQRIAILNGDIDILEIKVQAYYDLKKQVTECFDAMEKAENFDCNVCPEDMDKCMSEIINDCVGERLDRDAVNKWDAFKKEAKSWSQQKR